MVAKWVESDAAIQCRWCGDVVRPASARRPVLAVAAAALGVVLVTAGLACTRAPGPGPNPPAPTGAEATPPVHAEIPVVTRTSPASGAEVGGTIVRIAGSGFTGVKEVDFGAARARDIKVDSSGTLITVVSPAGAGTVAVTVITSVGRSAVSAYGQFTYLRSAAQGLPPAMPPLGHESMPVGPSA